MTGILRYVSKSRSTGHRIFLKELCERKAILRMVAGKISSSINETHPISQLHLSRHGISNLWKKRFQILQGIDRYKK